MKIFQTETIIRLQKIIRELGLYLAPLELNSDKKFIEFRERHLDILTILVTVLGGFYMLGFIFLDHAKQIHEFEKIILARIVITLLFALNLSTDLLLPRSRKKMKVHMYIGFYLACLPIGLFSVYEGFQGGTYWMALAFLLIIWFAFTPFSYKEIAVSGLFFIIIYFISIYFFDKQDFFTLRNFELVFYLSGIWFIGLVYSLIQNRLNIFIYLNRLEIQKEREKSDELLRNIFPEPIILRLKKGENAIADSYNEIAILFADLVGFSSLSKNTSPEKLVSILNSIFTQIDQIVEANHLEKIKTIGDAYMIVGGIDGGGKEALLNICNSALEILKIESELVEPQNKLQIRIGIHFGPAVAGIIGIKKYSYDLWGDTINIASRLESSGVPGKVQVSDTVQSAMQSHFSFESRGLTELKGIGTRNTFFLQEK